MKPLILGIVVFSFGISVNAYAGSEEAINLKPNTVSAENADSKRIKIDMELTGTCTDVQTPDNPVGRLPGVAGGFSPAWAIRDYYENTRMSNVMVDVTRAKITILEGPKHGNVVTLSGTDPTMGPYYQYNPNPGFRGADNVTALVGLDGKRIKVHIKFVVVQQVGDQYPPDNKEANACVHSKTIKPNATK